MGLREPLIVDPTYGTGIRLYQIIAPTLRSHRFGLLVYIQTNGTNMQTASTENTMANATSETLEKSNQKKSPTTTYLFVKDILTSFEKEIRKEIKEDEGQKWQGNYDRCIEVVKLYKNYVER